MKCPFCMHGETRVIDSRLMPSADQVRRRRECESCAERFNTLEVPQLHWPRVIKRDMSREQFLEDKLRAGFLRAFEKLSVPTDVLDSAIARIKKKLITSQEREVSTETLGLWVLDELQAIDHIAYIRFASVHRRFENIEQFYKILESLA